MGGASGGDGEGERGSGRWSIALGLTNAANDTSGEQADVSPRPRRLAWAGLLARVFAIDVTICRKCGGRMRILEVVSDPNVLTALHLGTSERSWYSTP